MTSEFRDWLRMEVSRHRKERLRKDSMVAELELRDMIGDPFTVEEQAVLLAYRGLSFKQAGVATGMGHSKVYELCKAYGVRHLPSGCGVVRVAGWE